MKFTSIHFFYSFDNNLPNAEGFQVLGSLFCSELAVKDSVSTLCKEDQEQQNLELNVIWICNDLSSYGVQDYNYFILSDML